MKVAVCAIASFLTACTLPQFKGYDGERPDSEIGILRAVTRASGLPLGIADFDVSFSAFAKLDSTGDSPMQKLQPHASQLKLLPGRYIVFATCTWDGGGSANVDATLVIATGDVFEFRCGLADTPPEQDRYGRNRNYAKLDIRKVSPVH